VFIDLIKLLFSGFLQFKGNFFAIPRHITEENELISHQHRVTKRTFIPVKARD